MKQLKVLLVLAMISVVPIGQCGIHNDSAGFSITLPEAWVAISNPGRRFEPSTSPPELREYLRDNEANIGKINAIFTPAGFMDNRPAISVAVQQGELPINEQGLAAAIAALKRQGQSVDGLSGRCQRIGANNAIIIDYTIHQSIVPFPIRQRTVWIAGGGKSFSITCAASVDTFSDFAGTFDRAIESFKVTPVPPGLNEYEPAGVGGFDFWPAVIAMVVLAALAASWKRLCRLFSRRRAS